ncbi:BLISTER [Euphorbia peplus]|nr:BLISTER [Euphorbia peplus]
MASAQVLPSSRKQEHLQAGKRRLEEFRKKKAADKAKKAAAPSLPHASDASIDQKEPLEDDRARLTDTFGAGTSDGPGRTAEPFDTTFYDDHVINTTNKIEPPFLKDAGNPSLTSDYQKSLPDLVQIHSNNYEFSRYDAPGFARTADGNHGQESGVMSNDSKTNVASQSVAQYIAPQSQGNQGFDSSSSLLNRLHSTEYSSFLKDSAFTPSQDSTSQLQTKYSMENFQPTINLRGSSPQVEQDMQMNGSMNSYFGERNFSSSLGGFSSTYGKVTQTSESSGFDSDVKSSLNNVQPLKGTYEPNSRRSRPSFLDSINVSKASSWNSSQHTEQQEPYMPGYLNSNGMDGLGSTACGNQPVETDAAGQRAMPFSVNSSNGVDPMVPEGHGNGLLRMNEFDSSKNNEDFYALEQHIEDLTQEKFSLQRALEASRALAESLAAENSSLTDNYNHQRSFVNQLKSDMENLQKEIKAHLVELESVKMEYANAKLECNAADERSKILASEVIGLEEKALRLRSNELKLERQLENSHADLASYKKKMSSIEKDRQDLQSTIDALQEEKKLLQSKLRKASESGISTTDLNKSASSKKDISTSTEDLDVNSDPRTYDAESHNGNDSRSTNMLPDDGLANLGASSVYIPSDQLRMIENINTLVSELALEKEELMQALASESSQCLRLKDINKELSRKLEAQTQRLELLTAQNMVNENVPAKLPETRNTQENTPYADEGDEVVERVLGWIMKLFPGGPSKRRTSKLL